MVQDLVHNLCESLVKNIDGVAGIGKKTPPTPITYLTQWKIVGNSEVHGNEIWSCGEYNAIDGKYHILVQPLGGSIADIALNEPLRKINTVADKIEFPSDTEGKALVTRTFKSILMANLTYISYNSTRCLFVAPKDCLIPSQYTDIPNVLTAIYNTVEYNVINDNQQDKVISIAPNSYLGIRDNDYTNATTLRAYLADKELIYELNTPTTELVDAPQIQEADSYSMVISQGGKAVSWSEFIYTLNYLLTDSQNNLLVDSENYQLTVQN